MSGFEKGVVVFFCIVIVMAICFSVIISLNMDEKADSKKEYVGEYCIIIGINTYSGENIYRWNKFTKGDVQDSHDDYIKIDNVWMKDDGVFYYDDIYDGIREKIAIGSTKEIMSYYEDAGIDSIYGWE